MKNTFAATLGILFSTVMSTQAIANCDAAYNTQLAKLEDARTSADLAGASGLLAGGLTISVSYGNGSALGVAMIAGGAAVATYGNIHNSAGDLTSGQQLIAESRVGDGYLLRMLQSEISHKGRSVSISDLAAKINGLNSNDLICPAHFLKDDSRVRLPFGYSAIKHAILTL